MACRLLLALTQTTLSPTISRPLPTPRLLQTEIHRSGPHALLLPGARCHQECLDCAAFWRLPRPLVFQATSFATLGSRPPEAPHWWEHHHPWKCAHKENAYRPCLLWVWLEHLEGEAIFQFDWRSRRTASCQPLGDWGPGLEACFIPRVCWGPGQPPDLYGVKVITICPNQSLELIHEDLVLTQRASKTWRELAVLCKGQERRSKTCPS